MLAHDPITGELRLLDARRADRIGADAHGCPFCAGAEHETPPETGRIDGAADGEGWVARSFPNRYPLAAHHEVVVPSPHHVTSWRDLDTAALCAGMELLLLRRAALQDRAATDEAVQLFLNDGAGAGGSIEHVHAQLAVLPATPAVRSLVAGVRAANECVLCALAGNDELAVWRGEGLVLAAHPLPRMGGGLVLFPAMHASGPCRMSEAVASGLEQALCAAEPGALNAWLVADERRRSHWYLEVMPRTSGVAVVELAYGLPVATIEPAAAAARARERLANRA